ncbi:probable mitochondrial adenine nucleotide transporter BTL3 isoform X2 [Magnolia sinica]|uniref:probable mitochondrial adenine nucleotide transporter BTL3 isoform X2 n=1 Tax=Magnolia sinica TaxID=86752 RepID=UPI002659D441|nr:probable mitochondrial adenine nucleotide transporter BTL3 isoform X2 [Magnolia sinica]
MQPSCSSTCILQKYFPELLPLSSEAEGDVLCTDISVSTFSSAILRSTHVQKSRAILMQDFFSKLPGVIFNVKVLRRRLRFTNVAQVAFLRRCLHGGIKEQEKETEWNSDEGVDSKAGSSRGLNSWNDMPKFLLAGAVSTIVSRTCVAPLERIKLECIIHGSKQSWIEAVQWIWASEGVTGFWKGNVLNLFRMVPFKSINFICYDMYCDRLLRIRQNKEITNRDRLIGGGISGITATILCLPLDTIRTRLIAQGGQALGGVSGCFFHMIRNEGILSLYKGLTPALISMGPGSAVFYTVYDILKVFHLSHNNNDNSKGKEGELGIVRALVYGAIAGACAETVTYPLEVIRRQLQLQRTTRFGLFAVFVKMRERDGGRSLFAGLVPSTLQIYDSSSQRTSDSNCTNHGM